MEVAVEEEMVGGFHTTISEAQLLQLSAKGKRTKRPRSSSVQSLNVVAALTNSSSSSDIDQYRLLPSPATTASSAENTTDEDEDMANCLILLARSGGGGGGGGQYGSADDQKDQIMRVIRRRKKIIRSSSSGIIIGSTTTSNYSKRAATGSGSEVYECKTCNRCFPSFQALGGHRASHKKPRPPPVPINGAGVLAEKEIIKMAAEDIVTVATTSINDHLQDQLEAASHDHGGFGLFKETSTLLPTATTSNMITMMTSMMPPTPPAVLKSMMIIAPTASSNSNKNKVHECAICGSEFNSGQALGGHMRRHRIVPELPNSKNVVNIVNKASKINIDTTTATNSTTFTLDLDLNLPAPDELADHDHHVSPDFAIAADDHEFADASITSTSEWPAAGAAEFGNKLIMSTHEEKNIGFKSKQPLLFTPLVDCHN